MHNAGSPAVVNMRADSGRAASTAGRPPSSAAPAAPQQAFVRATRSTPSRAPPPAKQPARQTVIVPPAEVQLHTNAALTPGAYRQLYTTTGQAQAVCSPPPETQVGVIPFSISIFSTNLSIARRSTTSSPRARGREASRRHLGH
jgi:hypothetical protein